MSCWSRAVAFAAVAVSTNKETQGKVRTTWKVPACSGLKGIFTFPMKTSERVNVSSV